MSTPKPIQETIQGLLERHPHLRRLSEMQDLFQPAEPDPKRNQETPDERAERLERKRQVIHANWLATVPPMYADAAWADLDPEQRPDWPDVSLNLVLAGPVGTGKTHAAYAIGNTWAGRGRHVHASTVVDLLAAHRPDGSMSVVTGAQSADLLILDDLGAGRVSEFALETMTALMDRRIRMEVRTIVTTNVPEADLEATWGGRFMDRLRYKRTVHVYRGESRRAAAW